MNYHQGDVFLIRIEKIPEGAKLVRKGIIAYSEATGHTHQLMNSLFYEKEEKSYLRVTTPEKITHEEHPYTETVEIGDYEVKTQEEYFPEGNRKAKD